MQTELQLVTSAPVQQAVRGTLDSTPAVSVAEVAQTNVIAITATSPARPARPLIANLYATSFVAVPQAVAMNAT